MSDSPSSGFDPRLSALIDQVQRARLEHDAAVLPSQVHGTYWIECKRPSAEPAPTARVGVFVIPARRDQLDALWLAVRAATLRGDLGYKSKVATGRRDPIIHVATYDADDAPDVGRVRTALSDLLTPFGLAAADLDYQRAR